MLPGRGGDAVKSRLSMERPVARCLRVRQHYPSRKNKQKLMHTVQGLKRFSAKSGAALVLVLSLVNKSSYRFAENSQKKTGGNEV